MSDPAVPGPGVLGKPAIEKLKLLVLFLLVGVLIYYSRPRPETYYPGLILVVLGTLVRVWAAGHLRRDQTLTTSGPYQHCRNPFYLGRLLLLIGFALMSGLDNLILWAIFIVALIFFFLFYMPRKEQREGGRLRDLFGPDYEQWKSHVPSLFPRLTPYRMDNRRWSKHLFMGGDDNYSGNKEWLTTLAIAVVAALFYWRMVA